MHFGVRRPPLRWPVAAALILAGLGSMLAPGGLEAQDPATAGSVVPTVMLVVDTSGSMSEEDSDGGIKIEGSRAALIEFLAQIEPATRIGLRTYPDPSASDCNDGDLDIGIDERDPSRMDATVRTLTPDGDTPTAEALTAAAADLEGAGDNRATIVLVSDGESTCEDPCVAAEQIAAGGLDIQILAVGLAVSEDAVNELTCIADATGGTYIDASDTDALRDIFDDLSLPALQLSLSHPDEAVAEAGPGEGGQVTITADVANTGEILARDVRASIDLGGTVVTTAPTRALGNLDVGDTSTVTWAFRPGVSLVNNTAGRSIINFEVLVTASNLRAEVRDGGQITIVDASSRDDAGPILRDPERIAILGDSFSSGEGAGPYRPGTDDVDNRCHRSRNTYLAEQFTIPDELNLACSGAVSAHISSPNFDYDLEAQINQLHEQQRDESVDLVVLTMGGNDAGFETIIKACLKFGASCRGSIGGEPTDEFLDQRFRPLPDQLAEAYRDIDAVLNAPSAVSDRGGHARIIVLAYPRLFPGADRPCGATVSGMNQDELDFGSALITRLNGVVEGAAALARRAGVPISFVPTTEDAFLPGHTVCDGDGAYVRHPSTADVSLGRGAVQELFHPNDLGYSALTRALVRWSISDSAPTGPVHRSAPPRTIPPTVDLDQSPTRLAAAEDRPSLRPGQAFRLAGEGYDPLSPVEVSLTSDLHVLHVAYADGTGKLDATVAIPPRTPAGAHTVTAFGLDRNGEATINEVRIEVPARGWDVPVLPIVSVTILVMLGIGLSLSLVTRPCAKKRPGPT